jgi:hypothetical protein
VHTHAHRILLEASKFATDLFVIKSTCKGLLCLLTFLLLLKKSLTQNIITFVKAATFTIFGGSQNVKMWQKCLKTSQLISLPPSKIHTPLPHYIAIV